MVPVAGARHYVSIGTRQVHYRRTGAGPPIVLLHGGLGASGTLTTLMDELADHFTVIAVDLPGCGSSSALETANPSITDYASAVHEAIQALGIRRTDLYGKHTGAKIALALAVEHPEEVRHLTLDVLSLSSAGDVSGRLAAYAPSIEPSWHGGHLLELWHQVRNAGLFFPWYDQTAAARLNRDLAKPESIHAQVVDVLCANADYRLLFAANYGWDAKLALAKVSVPTTILVHEGDPTASEVREASAHLGRAQVAVLPRAADPVQGVVAVILGADAAEPHGMESSPTPSPAERIPGAITRDYVVTQYGRLHLRIAGRDDSRPLVVLHAGPGSARGLEPLIDELSRTRSVVGFDTLGHGGSDPPPAEPTDIGLYANSVLDGLEHLGVGHADVFGTHTGSLIAIEMALRDPKRVGRLVLDGVPLFTPQERDDLLANYIPVLRPLDDGTHLVKLWHMLRDMTLFWPWYRHSTKGIRPFPPADAEGLHRRMVDTVPALTTYHLAYSAAFRYPTGDRLPGLQHQALICAGPSDPLMSVAAEAARLAPSGELSYTPGSAKPEAITETANTYAHFLDH
jgi:pimeloyl-ACP methyl ester carboxylesterase